MMTGKKSIAVGWARGVLTAGVLWAATGCDGTGPLGNFPGLFGGGGSAGLKLIANLSSGDVQAQVEYDADDHEASFEVTVSGGAPGQVIEITVDGVVVASVTLDDTGGGHLRFSSDPDEADEQQMPDGFPEPDAGDDVAVGDMSGSFAHDDSDDGDDDDGESSEFELHADLTAGTFQAVVHYEEDGDEAEFSVAVSGGEPGSAVDVSVAGVVVASLTLDANGAGRVKFADEDEADDDSDGDGDDDDSDGDSDDDDADDPDEQPFPDNFPVLVAGDAVVVGPASGTLVADDSGDDSDDDDDDADDGSDDNSDDDADDAADVELAAVLSDGTMTANVRYEADGMKSEFEVSLSGGQPGAVLDVLVAGYAVGALR